MVEDKGNVVSAVVMSEHSQDPHYSHTAKALDKRFVIFIGGSIVIAFILVCVSMYLYQKSGAAQLDLSRPSYEGVRAKAQSPDKLDGFSATGKLDKESLDEFRTLYDKTSAEIDHDKDSFNPDSVDNKALGIKTQ